MTIVGLREIAKVTLSIGSFVAKPKGTTALGRRQRSREGNMPEFLVNTLRAPGYDDIYATPHPESYFSSPVSRPSGLLPLASYRG